MKYENQFTETMTLSRKKRMHRNWVYGYLFILPTVGGFVAFSLIPTIAVFILSFFKWDLINAPEFLGISNYINLFQDAQFWHVLKVTSTYVLYNIPIQIVLSMILALALSKQLFGTKIFRVVYLIPWVTTPVAVAIVWRWVLNPQNGLMNYFLETLGFSSVNWFSSSMALKSVVMVNIWQHTGFTTLLLLIGILSIPTTYFEAAQIDGANRMKMFWKITLPLLRPMLMFVLITGFIGSFQVFDTVYAMTSGGPGDATKVYYFALYQEGFQFLNMGYSATMSVILFFILMCVTLIQLRFFRNTTYDMS